MALGCYDLFVGDAGMVSLLRLTSYRIAATAERVARSRLMAL